MTINYPDAAQIPALRQIWISCFGDTDAFLDNFFGTAFSPDRCRCITVDGQIAAVLYWLPVFCEGVSFAYLYAIATHPEYRNRGLCRQLMADTEAVLKDRGYAGALLRPQNEDLARMYRSMGYEYCTCIAAFEAVASNTPAPIRKITGSEYAALRRRLLPPGAVVQEQENMAFLETQAALYAGAGFLAAVDLTGGNVRCQEFLGNRACAPDLLCALNVPSGSFRTCGKDAPFVMGKFLAPGCPKPTYFGLPFD